MKYPLSTTSLVEVDTQGRKLRSPVTSIMAEAGLGQYSGFGFPNVFTGKLIDASEKNILDFKFLPAVEVVFRGSVYKFEELDKDCSFILRRG